MKKLFTLATCLLVGMSSFAQNHTVHTEYGYMHGGGVEVDLNNDGYQDIIMGGIARNKYTISDPDGNDVETDRSTKVLLFDPATKTYVEKPVDFLNSNRAQFICADFNGDGIIDLVCTDSAVLEELYGGGIYQGNGDGTFTKQDLTFDDPAYQFLPVTIDVADFNNDGLVDIVAIGYRVVNGETFYSSAVLINKGNYNFDVTNTDLLQEYKLALAVVKAFDFDNDGYMDFFVTGNCDNKESNGGARVLADVFQNMGEEEPGAFYRRMFGDDAIRQKANGGFDIADFNNDGYLDIVLHGEGGEGTGEPATGDWTCISHMYLNQKGDGLREKTQSSFLGDLRPLNSTHNATRAIDWTGNGHYDLFVPGWCTTMPDGAESTQAGFMFTNDGAANLTRTRIPGASEAFILFPDWNGDGVKDYFMSGQSWDSNYFTTDDEKGRTAAIILNTNAKAARPDAPAGVTASVKGNSVTISWTAAANAMKNFTYEYFIKDSKGRFITSCAAHVGGELDGVRKLTKLGNGMMNTSITLNNISGGSYTCGVQAVNAAYDGSVFTTSSFVIEGGSSVDSYNTSSIDITAMGNTLSVKCDGKASLDVYNAAGLLIDRKNIDNNYSSNLASGIYIVKVIAGNETVSEKVVIR